MDQGSASEKLVRIAGFHLRGASGRVAAHPGGKQSLADLQRTQRSAYSLCKRTRILPHRTAPNHGASLRRLLGLPDPRLLRRHQPVWSARRLHGFRRSLSQRRNRSHPQFDGTHLYEHSDPRQGTQLDWGTLVYNYGRNEVRNYLISNALFWLDKYHIDGLRVDAVASMIYLDYSRKPGEWIPNKFGGRENLEAVDFLKRLNEITFERFPGILTIAEESTAWPSVSRPTYLGGLGFSMKWNMGWMNDTLRYFSADPVHRKYEHNKLTFSLIYAFTENFVLPFSHDEVVHGKNSLLHKMPGDMWQQFANLRLLYAYQYAHPGKKLLFMGEEFGQRQEFSEARSLDWHLLQWESHRGLQRLVGDLNKLYAQEPALHEVDFDWPGFEWIDANDADNSIFSFARHGKAPGDLIVVILNATPVLRGSYRIGVPQPGFYVEALNTDSAIYGGSNAGNLGGVQAEAVPHMGRPYSLTLTVPPLGALFLKWTPEVTPRAN